MRVRVVCGLSETMAIFVPMMRLRSVDLPAFGRPMMETNPALTGGLSGVHLDGLRLAEPALVDAPALRLEDLDDHAVDLERLSDRGHASEPRQHVAAHRLEPFGLDVDAQPLADFIE